MLSQQQQQQQQPCNSTASSLNLAVVPAAMPSSHSTAQAHPMQPIQAPFKQPRKVKWKWRPSNMPGQIHAPLQPLVAGVKRTHIDSHHQPLADSHHQPLADSHHQPLADNHQPPPLAINHQPLEAAVPQSPSVSSRPDSSIAFTNYSGPTPGAADEEEQEYPLDEEELQHIQINVPGNDRMLTLVHQCREHVVPLDERFRHTFIVQWLLENYEAASEQDMVVRRLVWHHFRNFSIHHGIGEVPTIARFGRLVRVAFPRVTVRRTGSRHQCKYRYCGIRLRPSLLVEHEQRQRMLQQSVVQPVPAFAQESMQPLSPSPINKVSIPPPTATGVSLTMPPSQVAPPVPSSFIPSVSPQEQELLKRIFPGIPAFPGESENQGLSKQFIDNYYQKCCMLLHHVHDKEYDHVLRKIRVFWNHLNPAFRMLLMEPGKAQHLYQCDVLFYEAMIVLLFPDILQPLSPKQHLHIREFGHSLQQVLDACMQEQYDESIERSKKRACKLLTYQMDRHLQLDNLTNAVHMLLCGSRFPSEDESEHAVETDVEDGQEAAAQRTSTVRGLLLEDWKQVDFETIQDRIQFVHPSGAPGQAGMFSPDIFQQLDRDVQKMLGSPTSLKEWSLWIRRLQQRAVNQYYVRLKQYSDTNRDCPPPSDHLPTYIREYVQQWTMTTSLLERDFTLRSAASFGQFHLVRTWWDEFCLHVADQEISQWLEQKQKRMQMGVGGGGGASVASGGARP